MKLDSIKGDHFSTFSSQLNWFTRSKHEEVLSHNMYYYLYTVLLWVSTVLVFTFGYGCFLTLREGTELVDHEMKVYVQILHETVVLLLLYICIICRLYDYL